MRVPSKADPFRAAPGLAITCLCAFASLAPYPVVAAPAEQANIVVQAEELPRYFVVQAFFDRALHYRDVESPWPFHLLQQELGIEPGSKSAERLEAAMNEARVIREMPTVDLELTDEAEFWEFQMNALRKKARLLGRVYGALVRDLARLGDADERLEAYLETEVRPTNRLITKDRWPDEALEAVSSFDSEVDAVLRRAGQ